MEKINKMKEKVINSSKFLKIKTIFNKFFSSDLYIIMLFIIAIINWKFKLTWLVFLSSILFNVLIYILKVSKLKIIPIAISIIISLGLEDTTRYIIPLLITGSVLLVFISYDLIKRKIDFNNKIITGMVLIFIASIFSLVNSPVLLTSIQGISMWVFYILLFLYMFNMEDIKKDKDYARYYIAKIFVYFSLAIFIEIILYYIEYGIGQNVIAFYGGNEINFGWAEPQHIANVYLLILPILVYYFTLDQKKYYLLLIIGIDLAMLHLMLSRGAYLAMIILLLPIILKAVNDVKRKTNFIISVIYFTIIILVLMIVVAIPTGYVKDFFAFLSTKGHTLEDMELMSRIGIGVFERYPLFGGGFGSSRYYLSIVMDNRYYENFIVQTLSDIGIVGFIAFGYYLFSIFKYSTIKDKYNSYVLLIVIALTIQGLMETTFYNPLVMILLSFIFPLMTSKEELIYMKGD